MNRIFATMTALALAAIPAAASAGNVEVALGAVRAGGTLYVSLQTRDQFMKNEGAYGKIVAAPKAGPLLVTLEDVAPGDYAVTIWHDDNGNGTFDMDPASGRPRDGWAAVNGETLRAQPTFDQVKIAIGADGAKVPLAVQYAR